MFYLNYINELFEIISVLNILNGNVTKNFILQIILSCCALNLKFSKIYTTLGSLSHPCESETRVPSSRGLVKQYNQELCISLKILNLEHNSLI